MLNCSTLKNSYKWSFILIEIIQIELKGTFELLLKIIFYFIKKLLLKSVKPTKIGQQPKNGHYAIQRLMNEFLLIIFIHHLGYGCLGSKGFILKICEL